MRRFAWCCLVLGILAAVAVPGWAEPPAGFANLPWGTPSNQVSEYASAEQLCVFVWKTIDVAACERYDLPGVGQGTVRFFWLIPPGPDPPRAAGTLAGYRLTFPSSGYTAFRRLVVEKYGPPHQQKREAYTTGAGATVTGEFLGWRWPEAMARLWERCGELSRFCLEVATPALQAQEAARAQREREQAKKGF